MHNRVCRSILCILVICCLVFNLSPLKARATGLEVALIGASAAAVVGSIMIGLGILPGSDTSVFENTVNSCVADLSLQGLVQDGMVNYVRMLTNWHEVSYGLTEDLINAVRSWTIANQITFEVMENVMVSESFGFGLRWATTYDEWNVWAKSLDLYTMVADAAYTETLLLTSTSISSTTDFGGLGLYEIAALGVPALAVSYVSTLNPYLSTTVPVGAFADLSGATVAHRMQLFRNYDDAVVAYTAYHAGTYSDSYDKYYLQPTSYLEKNASNTLTFQNVGCINARTGVVVDNTSYTLSLNASSAGGKRLNQVVVPAAFEIAEVATMAVTAGLAAGVIGNTAEKLEVAYPAWVANARVVGGSDVGKDNNDDVKIYPWFPTLNLDDVLDQTQEDVWEGTKTETDTETDTDTDKDQPVVSPSVVAPFLVDLKDFFPFCIPFDLYEFFKLLCAEPEAPVFHWEITDLSGETYPIDIDLSSWDTFAAFFRYLQLFVFIIGLAMASRKFIKW